MSYNTPPIHDAPSPSTSRPLKRSKTQIHGEVLSFSEPQTSAYDRFWSQISPPSLSPVTANNSPLLPAPTLVSNQPNSSSKPQTPAFIFQAPLTPSSQQPRLRRARTLATPTSSAHLLLTPGSSGSARLVSPPTVSATSTPPSAVSLGSLCAPFKHLSKSVQIDGVLQILRNARVSPLELVTRLACATESQDTFRRQWYREDVHQLEDFLDAVMDDDNGKTKLQTWMKPHAISLVSELVYDEMSLVQKRLFLPSVNSITPEFLSAWSWDSVIQPAVDLAPTLNEILLSASQTTTAKAKNKKKKPKKLCSIAILELAHQRSNFCMQFAGPFALSLWSTGTQRKTIDALYACGLSISYDSITTLLKSLSAHWIRLAQMIVKNPHAYGYDNVNICLSIFIEQRGSGTPRKVQSGTFSMLYPLRLGSGVPNPVDILLPPIMERRKSCEGLVYARDLRPSMVELVAMEHHFSVTLTQILLEFCSDFNISLSKDPKLQHIARRPLPEGYKTKYYPLRTTTIEEATVQGNLAVHEDSYLNQLKMTDEDLSKTAILTINDVLTNQRIRAAQMLRVRDLTPWSRREVFQIAIGLFHLCMNLIWALLHVHRGTLAQMGSLTYFFTLIEKTRLGNHQPDYHTLLAAMMQILNGLVLESWRQVSGFPNLSSFARSKPSADQLLQLASTILADYASPVPASSPAADDTVHGNVRLLMRDLLYVLVLVRAISDGDFGRVEMLLPNLAMIFRGAGSNNYCAEILHLILNLKHIWTPVFADIVRDNSILNMSGNKGHGIGVDMNCEHGIDTQKGLFIAKGMYSTWDRLGDISACIVQLDDIKKRVCVALGTPYYNRSHKTPDTSKLTLRVAAKARELELLVHKPGRDENKTAKCSPDLLALGQAKLCSSSLRTFNKKNRALVFGISPEDENDELPPMELGIEDHDESY